MFVSYVFYSSCRQVNCLMRNHKRIACVEAIICATYLKHLNSGIIYYQIAAKQFWNFVEDSIMLLSRHPVRYNNAGLSSAPFPRKLEADHP